MLICVHKPAVPVLSLNNKETFNSVYALSELS